MPEIEYPDSDGQPMAESPYHAQVMIDLMAGLQARYARVESIWVRGNFFLFYEEGNPKARVSPDVLLAKGMDRRPRRNYLLWEEKTPSLIVEVTSRKTRRKDTGLKKEVYERIGVEEYILFDPFKEYLRPQLQGYRLEWGRYQPIPLAEDGTLLSRTTGLRVKSEGWRLRLIDAATREPILWAEEIGAARRDAEARVEALEEELKRIRGA